VHCLLKMLNGKKACKSKAIAKAMANISKYSPVWHQHRQQLNISLA